MSLWRKIIAEAVGTAFLLSAVVGSGIMGERLAAGNTAMALLANTLATGAALVALILAFGPRVAPTSRAFRDVGDLDDRSSGVFRPLFSRVALRLFSSRCRMAGWAQIRVLGSEGIFAPVNRQSTAALLFCRTPAENFSTNPANSLNPTR